MLCMLNCLIIFSKYKSQMSEVGSIFFDHIKAFMSKKSQKWCCHL